VNGALARRGRYAFRVVAANNLGRVELTRPFTLA
jgi:hypothetical protein